MTLAATTILAQIESHALASGWFERVNRHEPKSSPGNGLTAAIWAQSIGPLPVASGLAATTSLIVFNVRVYTSMLQEPQDEIDPNVLGAVDALISAYSADFELGGNVRNIDLLGAHSPGLRADAGYLNQDGKLYRVMTITMPVVVNDLWSQSG
jgi:hypothetical protein